MVNYFSHFKILIMILQKSHSSVAAAWLWKKQISPPEREALRSELAALQAPVAHLKNPRHAPLGLGVGGRTSLVRNRARKPKEPSIRTAQNEELWWVFHFF